MGVCNQCGIHFPSLSSETCMKCKKLLSEDLTSFQKEILKKHPQCAGCSVVYQFTSKFCGACSAGATSGSEPQNITATVAHRTREFQTGASDQRLNRALPQNPALVKASAARLKAKEVNSNASRLLILINLLYYPVRGGDIRKAAILTELVTAEPGDDALETLERIKQAVQRAYNEPRTNTWNLPALVNWKDAYYAVSQSNIKKSIRLADTYTQGTVKQMFNGLRSDRLIGDADGKARRFGISVVVDEVLKDWNSDDGGESSSLKKKKHRPSVASRTEFCVPPLPKKRKMDERASQVATRELTRSAADVSSKPRYVSSFRPPARVLEDNRIPSCQLGGSSGESENRY
ncbi:hypothetical protein FA15DRAFT_731739 [Coprinopsis marcescibilis]|uniref:Uncharacterized protein n=1 Tax=Coprinopsis marcescibilis TaxID=230819 RepID=A0A5C3LA10_COPMA|nr:hypothetical protein FA15DRAFT_731739 [Coprinopsis marcescibilis]